MKQNGSSVSWNLIRFCLYNFLNYVGINVCLVLFGWIVVDRGGNATVIAAYTAVTVLVSVITSATVGPLIDKHNNFTVLRMVSLVEFVSLITYIGYISEFKFNFAILFILGSISGACITIYNTASRGTITAVLRKDQLVLGNSMLEVCIQSGAIVASLASGFVYSALGERSMMAMTAIFFAMGGILIFKLPMPVVQEKATYLNSLIDGYKFVFKNKVIFILGTTMVLSVLATLLSNTILPLYVNGPLHQNSTVFGLVDTMFGIGAVVGGVLGQHLAKKKLGFYYLLSCACLFPLIMWKNIILLVVLYVVFGASNTALKILLNAKVMSTIPDAYYGQTMLFFNNLQSVLQIIMAFVLARVINITTVPFGYTVLILMILLSYVLYRVNIKSVEVVLKSN
ncbi:MAG: MFS transporter [Liquorilactobacillus nagelii]|uniref:MFS transporter n=2 Tax=Liquorilactobacillus nagelii TaxID=82688 RepID=UPI002431239C|nr:MFS transporter [Liquorilactobacillus nagelii]MCI1633944.1 MFS transporter [Liquorilactobacillus nagelii]